MPTLRLPSAPRPLPGHAATLLLAALCALAGCGEPERPAFSPVAAAHADDRAITRAVDAVFAADPFMQGGAIVAVSDDGQLRLTGAVDDRAQIDRALALAFGVAGVRRIEHSLAVRGAAALAAAAETDRVVGTRVRAMLLADAEVKRLDIEVQARSGAVLLSGAVARQAQIDRAVQITRLATGVRSVSHTLRLER